MKLYKICVELLSVEIILTIVAVLIFVGFNVFLRFVKQHSGSARNPSNAHLKNLVRVLRSIGIIILGIVVIMIWGFEIEDVWIFTTTVLGFLGVALFAVWSLISNIFAAYILFFSKPFELADTITYMDAPNTITGEVIDMTLFYVKIRTSDSRIANIPNNIILQKPIFNHSLVDFSAKSDSI